jgi:hypothetical protein
MLIHKIPETENNFDCKCPTVRLANKAPAIANVLEHHYITLETFISNVSGGESERRGIRVRLGGNSCPISTMPDVHHCHS